MTIIVNQRSIIGTCIRRGVQVVRMRGRHGVEYVPISSAEFADKEAFSCFGPETARRLNAAVGHYSSWLPADEWRTVPEGGAHVEIGEGAGPVSWKVWPAGTRYMLAAGGNAHAAASVWVQYPDRAYGPDARRA